MKARCPRGWDGTPVAPTIPKAHAPVESRQPGTQPLRHPGHTRVVGVPPVGFESQAAHGPGALATGEG